MESFYNADIEAINFIAFLGLNREFLSEARNIHINNILELRKTINDDELFIEILSDNWQQLSYITALEYELDMPQLWEQIRPETNTDEASSI